MGEVPHQLWPWKRLIPHSAGFELILSEEIRPPEPPKETNQLITLLKKGGEHIHRFKTKITKPKTLLDVSGLGGIKELTVISNKGDLRVICENDGHVVVDDTVEGLTDISPFVSTIEAVQYRGNYIFRIKDVSFVKRFKAMVVPNGETYIECFYNYFRVPEHSPSTTEGVSL